MIYTMKPRMSLIRFSLCLAALVNAGALAAQGPAIVRTHPTRPPDKGFDDLMSLLAESSADSARNPHTVQPERPTVATHAGTVARGWIELEEGAEWDRLEDRSRVFVAPTNLKIGLASRAQINILFNLIHAGAGSGPSGIGDLTLGVKYRILEGNPILGNFAILPAIKLPTGSVSTGTTDFSLLLISSYELGPVAVDLNVGQTRRSGNGSEAPKTSGIWTASFGFPVSGPVGGVLEFFGFPATTGPVGTKGIAAMLVGPTFLVRNWLALDAGVIVPISGPQARAVYTGFVWNFGCIATKRVCERKRSR